MKYILKIFLLTFFIIHTCAWGIRAEEELINLTLLDTQYNTLGPFEKIYCQYQEDKEINCKIPYLIDEQIAEKKPNP
jgi:hypothetical protein